MKTLIGLVALLVLILGIIWFTRNNPSFLSKVLNKKPKNGNVQMQEEKKKNLSGNANKETNEHLLVCTPELLAKDCSAVSKQPVCSVDVVVTKDGTEETSETQYISACHYCKFFGSDGTVDFGDKKIITRGYTSGACKGL